MKAEHGGCLFKEQWLKIQRMTGKENNLFCCINFAKELMSWCHLTTVYGFVLDFYSPGILPRQY